jgi:hypothetical protein
MIHIQSHYIPCNFLYHIGHHMAWKVQSKYYTYLFLRFYSQVFYFSSKSYSLSWRKDNIFNIQFFIYLNIFDNFWYLANIFHFIKQNLDLIKKYLKSNSCINQKLLFIGIQGFQFEYMNHQLMSFHDCIVYIFYHLVPDNKTI